MRPAAEAAANWWAERVGAPVFNNGSQYEEGQSRRQTELGEVMGSMLALSTPDPTEDQSKSFVNMLADDIETMLDRQLESGRPWVSLSVDYGPEPMLARAAERAGINTARFPWKTHMSVSPDHVTASLGYGSRTRIIWSEPDWEHPPCGNGQYDRTTHNRLPFACGKPRYHEDECVFDVPEALCTAQLSERDKDECARPKDHPWHTEPYDGLNHAFATPEVEPEKAKEQASVDTSR